MTFALIITRTISVRGYIIFIQILNPEVDKDVTMFQRGSTYIMSTAKGWPVLFGNTYWEGGPPVDIADRLTASFPHHMSVPVNQRAAGYVAGLDK
jgi:hypothetical protein